MRERCHKLNTTTCRKRNHKRETDVNRLRRTLSDKVVGGEMVVIGVTTPSRELLGAENFGGLQRDSRVALQYLRSSQVWRCNTSNYPLHV